jgi:hypothetical protein
VILLLLSSLLDHAGAFGYRGNDWRRFDGHRVHVRQVIDDQSFECDDGTVVRLLGVWANEERTTSFVQNNLEGRDVLLRQDVPQTRDADGELLAYVYLSPSDCFNIDLIHDGAGYADRQSDCSMLPAFIAAETARNRAIGRSEHKRHS